ncbi:MAG: hypothetical protein ACREN8_13060 [Candidatus Dormibacteraceae bacterium]
MSSKSDQRESDQSPIDRHLVIDDSGIRFYDGTGENHGAPSGEGVTVEIGPNGKAFFSGSVEGKPAPVSPWQKLWRGTRVGLIGALGVFAGAALILILIGSPLSIPANLPSLSGQSAALYVTGPKAFPSPSTNEARPVVEPSTPSPSEASPTAASNQAPPPVVAGSRQPPPTSTPPMPTPKPTLPPTPTSTPIPTLIPTPTPISISAATPTPWYRHI